MYQLQKSCPSASTPTASSRDCLGTHLGVFLFSSSSIRATWVRITLKRCSSGIASACCSVFVVVLVVVVVVVVVAAVVVAAVAVVVVVAVVARGRSCMGAQARSKQGAGSRKKQMHKRGDAL